MEMVMADNKTKQALKRYIDAAANLAELIKRNIQKDGCIDNKTVLALNEFVVASNEVADLTEQITATNIKYN